MGLVTGLAIAGLALGVAGSVDQKIQGGKQKRASKRAAKRFKRTEQKNAHEGRSVVTRGSKLALEENARTAATSIEALKSGGIRGVVGGSQSVQESTNRLNERVADTLDRQQVGIDRDKAADDVRIAGVNEARDNQELAAIQAQMNAGVQTSAAGSANLAQSGFAAANFAASGGFGSGGGNNGVTQQQIDTAQANGFRRPDVGSAFGVVNPAFTGQPNLPY